MFKVIPNRAGVDFTSYETTYSAICRLEGDLIEGSLRIEYRPKEVLIDVMSIETWVKQLVRRRLIVEEVARLAIDAAQRALGDTPVSVTVSGWTNGHARVEAQIYSRWEEP